MENEPVARPQRGRVEVRASDPAESPLILRFLSSERALHWSLAIPFVLLYLSALMMFVLYGEPQPRTWRTAFGWLHRCAGLGLMLLPPLALLRGRSEWRMHLENLREGWRWTHDDLRWLVLFPRAAMDARVKLPEQGKFNAAEKLNFMMVSATYPFYIVTGLMVWLPGVALLPYFAHMAVAVLGVPLVVGHIFMATVNPSTRIGLSGMITGWVDREWARHHYRRWYRERFERAAPGRNGARVLPLLQLPAELQCRECGESQAFASWEALLERSFRLEPLFCDHCHAEMTVAASYAEGAPADAILGHLEGRGSAGPFEAPTSEAA